MNFDAPSPEALRVWSLLAGFFQAAVVSTSAGGGLLIDCEIDEAIPVELDISSRGELWLRLQGQEHHWSPQQVDVHEFQKALFGLSSELNGV